MMKTTFTFLSKLSRPLFLVFGLVLMNIGATNAQCSLGCNHSIQVSLDNEDCEALVTPHMLLTVSTTCPDGEFYVELRYNGALLPDNPVITQEYVGKTLEGKVIDENSNNSCWTFINVEDKLAPEIDCEGPSELYCYEEYTYAPEVIENCGGYTLYVVDSVVTTNTCDVGLPANVIKRVTKRWIAVDDSGNESDICEHNYDVIRLDSLEEIKMPQNYFFPANSIHCEDNYPKDALGNPHPSYTGYPSLYGLDLRPDDVLPCNLLVDYSDDVIKDVQCVKKIARTWTVLEWSCDGTREYEYIQMLEIADTNHPVILGAKDLTVSTTPHNCEAIVNVPAVDVSDLCSAVTVTVSGGTPLIVGNGGQTSLPVGEHTLTYVATDACGNSTTQNITVYVNDMTPPVAVCDQNTTVSLTTDGLAWVNASVFDDGSYDECSLKSQVVKRMDPEPCDCHVPTFHGYRYLGEYQGHHYYLSQWPLAFNHAKKEAHALEGTLAVLDTYAEFDWVHSKVEPLLDDEQYYIGLERNHYDVFEWVDGTELTYENWDGGEPNNAGGNENAVEVYENGEWNDVPTSEVMRYVLEIDDICGFSDFVGFCCGDVSNQDLMVIYRAIDGAGNYNDCMVNVEVQDKLPPRVHCPADLTIDCDDFYETGDLVADFGDYQVYDNCETPTVVDSITLREVTQCNVGDLERTITVTGAGGRTDFCVQKIYIRGKRYNYNDIDWPDDVTINSCQDPDNEIFDPSETGYPVFVNDDQCNLLGSDYEDWVSTFNNPTGEACFKIIRKWSVIDWCDFDGYEYHTINYDQVIKVHDSTKPTITSSCERKSTCTYDASCTDGFIELTASGEDVCTEVLDYFYKVDLNNDGSFDSGLYKNTWLSNSGSGNVINASGVYPIGTHRIQYTFADKCGNVTTCDQIFDIINCKAPTAYCLNGLAVDLMPMDTDNDGEVDAGMAQLWASDFDAGSFHTCPEYDVYVSFSPDIHDTGRVFTCDDFGRADVMIYASVITPMGDTLQSFCNTFIDVQDNMNACDDDDDFRVGVYGNLSTENNKNLEGAEVILQGLEAQLSMTDAEGMYTFGQMPMGGAYTLTPSKNDDFLNGVSTLDLVLIQRHILTIDELSTPFQHIAADVNRDSKISASDLVELRKLILGITDKLENNTSWRFIDETVDFPANEDPLAVTFEDSYNIDALNSDMEIDFTSVKVGDVNGNVSTNARDNNLEPRSDSKLVFETENTQFSKGENVLVPFTTENELNVAGAQFTIRYDANALRFVGVTAQDIDVDMNNFGTTRIGEGVVTFSWNTANAVSAKNFFTLEFEGLTEGDIAETIALTSDITKAEAYDGNVNVMDVELRTNHDEKGLVLYQNIPNPFNEFSTIAFYMPKAGDATLSILDVTGKNIYTRTTSFDAGMNSIQISKSEMNLSGVMYYQLSVDGETLVKKMVIIE